MKRQTPLVLMYHGIGEVPATLDPDNLFVPSATFAAQLDRLVERGWAVIDEAGYLAALDGAPTPPRSVLLTFDDGYVSVLERAVPMLAARGLPALCYVSPGLDGRGPAPGLPDDFALMTTQQMRELVAAGVSLGCHGWDHQSMSGMDQVSLQRYTVTARDAVRAVIGTTDGPATFAYPFGHHDERAREAVADAGFSCAFATYTGSGRFALPRVDINATETPRSFDLKLRTIYPLARRALTSTPRVRQAVHRAVGHARRS